MKMKLWVEGYSATCESSPATFLGEFEAVTLKEAVLLYLKENPEEERWINLEKLTHWGRRFFDNEVEARKFYG